MRLLLALLLAIASTAALAQSLPSWAEPSEPVAPPPPSPEAMMTPTGSPATPTIVPIDGGLGLLALAGGAYAAARLRRRED